MRLSLLVIFAAASFFCVTACKTTTPQGDAAFDGFKSRFLEAYWQAHPEAGVMAGYYTYADRLTTPDEAARKATVAFCKRFSDSLKGFQPQSLNATNRTDYYILANQLEAEQWYTTDYADWSWNPSTYNIADPLNEILIKPFAPLAKRLELFSKHLETVPAYYAAAKKNLGETTKEHTELGIQQNNGTDDLLGKTLADSIAKAGLAPEAAKVLQERAAKAQAAIKDYVAFLDARLKDPATKWRKFQLGAKLYEAKFKYDIVTDNTAAAMFDKAMKHKQELHSKMAGLARQLWTKYYPAEKAPADSLEMIKQVIGKIAATHAKREDFVTTIRAQLPTLTAFINQHHLLTLDPTRPLEVRETPAYMRGTAGASCSTPGPYDKNGTTFYNVTPLDGYTPEKAESYLKEYNSRTLQILNIHEAIPGHYVQFVYANRSPSLVKSIFGNGAMIEGWAVYTERMMLEEGYGDNEPEMWLMYYKWNLRTTLNTILDIGIHTREFSREKVIAMLQNEGFQEIAEAEGKYRRATLTQVQLCSYFTGFKEIYDLRDEQKRTLKEKFNLQAFNEKFLSYGSSPVKYIREMMNESK